MPTDDAQRCPQCGRDNPAGDRFCGNCGTVLAAPPLSPGDRNPPVAVAEPLAAVVDSPAAPVTPAPVAPVSPLRVNAVGPPLTTATAVVRERERLLTLVNVQRMRGQTDDARKTLEQILAVSEGLPGRDIAPTQELLGDLYAADGEMEEALEAYRKANALDPARVGAERKFAAMTLEIADSKAEENLAATMLRGDSIADLIASGAMGSQRGRRNAGVAMLLSTVIPGFGQFYNGDFFKGAVLLGLYASSLLYFAVSPDRDLFVKKFAAIVAMSHQRAANVDVSPSSVFVGVLLVGVTLYSIVDAPFMASRTPKNASGPAIDKTGWEV